MQKLSIIVPVYNEIATIKEVYSKLKKLKLGVSEQIIFVDDGSTDGSTQYLQKLERKTIKGTSVLFQRQNKGKGAAVRLGLTKALGDWVIVQDADLEYSPQSIKRLLSFAKKNGVQAVFGSRNKRVANDYSYWYLYYGGKLLTLIGNFLYGQKLSDITTCYMLVSKKVLNKISLEQDGFGLEVELTAKLCKFGVEIKEVAIPYTPRKYEDGKKLRISDGIHALFLLFKYR